MSYELENFLNIKRTGNIVFDETVQSEDAVVPNHELNGRTISPLHVFYLTEGVLTCESLDLVTCASADVTPDDRLKPLFGIPEKSKVNLPEEQETFQLTATVVLGEDEVSKTKTADLLISMNGNLVVFHVYSFNGEETKERRISQTVITGGQRYDDETDNIKSDVWKNYSAILEMLDGIDKKEWRKSELCVNCPVKIQSIR